MRPSPSVNGQRVDERAVAIKNESARVGGNNELCWHRLAIEPMLALVQVRAGGSVAFRRLSYRAPMLDRVPPWRAINMWRCFDASVCSTLSLRSRRANYLGVSAVRPSISPAGSSTFGPRIAMNIA